MNPPISDDDVDRMLRDHLDAEVHDVTADSELLDRIKADVRSNATPSHKRSLRARWLLPVVAAAAAVVAVVFITTTGDGETDVATGENLARPAARVVLSGEAGGEKWSVVEYVEDESASVDEPTTCLRFEPPVEDGPFFCGTEDDILGAHGQLVIRRGGRFNDHAVFAGVFAPRVAEITLRVDGNEPVDIEPAPWPGHNLGIAVIMLPVSSDVGFGVDLTDADGEWLTRGSISDAEGTPGAVEPGTTRDASALVEALPEESRYLITVDVDALKSALGVPADHAFVPPTSEDDQTILTAVFSVLPHLRRPIDDGPAAAIDGALISRVAGNECAVGPECLAVLQTRQDPEDLRRRFLDEGWTADGGLLVTSASTADMTYPVVGITPDLVYLGQDTATVRNAIEGRTAAPGKLTNALSRVEGTATRAVPCGDTTAAIAFTPGRPHQIASQGDATVEVGDTVTIAGFDYRVADVATSEGWTVVSLGSTDAPERPLTHVADPNEPSAVPAALAAAFSC